MILSFLAALQPVGASSYTRSVTPVSEEEAADEFKNLCLESTFDIQSLQRTLAKRNDFTPTDSTLNGFRKNWSFPWGELGVVPQSGKSINQTYPPECDLTLFTATPVNDLAFRMAMNMVLSDHLEMPPFHNAFPSSETWWWQERDGRTLSVTRIYMGADSQQIELVLRPGIPSSVAAKLRERG